MQQRRAAWRRVLIALALVAAAWSALLLVTHGVVLRLGPLRVSSHNARNPAIAALLLAVLAGISAPRGARLPALADDASFFLGCGWRGAAWISRSLRHAMAIATRDRSLTIAVILLCIGVVALSWTRGAWIGGGADSFGYVHEAHLLARGQMRFRTPLTPSVSPLIPIAAATPLGYTPAADQSAMVPVYPPGLPLTLAVVERIAGGASVFLVSPALSALAIWLTYLLGKRVHGTAVGTAAALLVFAAPVFRFMVVSAPMSDIPAAAWWTLALVLVLSDGPLTAAAAGLAAGLAILTRPNLLVLAVPLGCYLLWRLRQERTVTGAPTGRLLLFTVGVIAGGLVEAWFNARWYGSPIRSGYDTGQLFAWTNWRETIRDYPLWLTISQTPLFFLGFAAPLLAARSRAAMTLLAGFAALEFLSYLFYMDFGVWWYLRFLLPAYPALAVASCVAIDGLAARAGRWRGPILATVVLGVAAFGFHYPANLDMRGDYRYRAAAEFVRNRLPPQAVVLSMQHSGSVILYSGRPIVRYDVVTQDLDAVLTTVRRLGYHPYAVLDGFEIEAFRALFAARSPRGTLAWPPLATVDGTETRVWDLDESPDAAKQRTIAKIPLE